MAKKWKSIIALMLLLVVPTFGAIQKTNSIDVLSWTTIALGSIQDSNEIVCSTKYATTLSIKAAVVGTTAMASGIEIIVEGRDTTSINNTWTVIYRTSGLAVTAVKSDCNDIAAAGQKVIYVTNPATGKLDHNGKYVFLYHADNLDQCQIVYQVSNTGDTGDTITIAQNLDYATATDVDVYTVDGEISAGQTNEAVQTWNVEIPITYKGVRVRINNNLSATGSSVCACVVGSQVDKL